MKLMIEISKTHYDFLKTLEDKYGRDSLFADQIAILDGTIIDEELKGENNE